MKAYTVTIIEKGAPELEQHGILAENSISAKSKAVANALIMGWKHPRVTRCVEEETPATKAARDLGMVS